MLYAICSADLVALLFFVPFLWSALDLVQDAARDGAGFNLLPNNPTLQAYRDALTTSSTSRATRRTASFSPATVTLTNLFLCSLGGYAFARLRFPGREVLFMLVLATLMIPDQLRLVPVFLMLSETGT